MTMLCFQNMYPKMVPVTLLYIHTYIHTLDSMKHQHRMISFLELNDVCVKSEAVQSENSEVIFMEWHIYARQIDTNIGLRGSV